MYLNCKTYFSLCFGTYGTEELVTEAADKGVSALALTNINTTADTWDFVDYCRDQGIQPVAGVEIRNDNVFQFILLAKNNQGFFFINQFLSTHLETKTDFPKRFPFNENIFVIYPFGTHLEHQHEFEGIQTKDISKLFARKDQSKLVILQPVTFQDTDRYHLHRLLRAIDRNIIISKQDVSDIAGKHESFVSQSHLIDAFKLYPAIVTNTMQLLNRCSIELEFGIDKSKQIFTSSRESDRLLLDKLAHDGFLKRYDSKDRIAYKRLVKELKIINDLGFNAYFLITWDFIRYASNRGFYYIGRGSGGNSIVAYCLLITDVDPIELDLYFERFLNPHRSVPPDFDMDFSWKDRDEMIDYIFKRYGEEHVCLLGSYTTFQTDSILRELGKVFGLPEDEIKQLRNGNLNEGKIQRNIQKYGAYLKNFPHHLSIHACGMLISDLPLRTYTATTKLPKGFPSSQIDMFVAEKIGLNKVDILSQRGLGHIKDGVEMVRQNQNIQVNIHEIEKFKQDKNLAAKIKSADTIGCFYIESPAMRQLLMKLRCESFLTLVAASSIIRPGVSQSGMMREYIYRFHNPDKFEYLHPKMKELLEETYGVMVYQEDVIKVAHHFAGLDRAEADVLRRAMSGKYRSKKQFQQITEKFFANCKNYGYPDELTREVWRQIESFAGYSFSKAHSASFAVESYQSLFLKTYYPREFMVAVINNFGGFYSTELYFHELKKTGVVIHLPCINFSEHLTRIKGNDVYIGLGLIQGLESKLISGILGERSNGEYTHLQEFIERVNPGIEQLNKLIKIGAFRFTGKSKKELLWEANFLQKKNANHLMGNLLFIDKPVEFKLPVLPQHPLDDAFNEIDLMGFSVCNVFDLVEADLSVYTPAREFKCFYKKTITVLGLLVTSKPVHTIKKENMFFHTFIDSAGEWLDTVFFPQVVNYSNVNGRGFYEMTGKVIEEFGVYTLDVQYCRKIGIRQKK